MGDLSRDALNILSPSSNQTSNQIYTILMKFNWMKITIMILSERIKVIRSPIDHQSQIYYMEYIIIWKFKLSFESDINNYYYNDIRMYYDDEKLKDSQLTN